MQDPVAQVPFARPLSQHRVDVPETLFLAASFSGIFKEATVIVLLRFFAYSLALFSITYIIPQLMPLGDVSFFTEGGPVEWFQYGVLIFSALIFLVSAARMLQFRELLLCLGFTSCFAITREMDTFLEHHMPFVGWKIGYVFIAAMGYIVFKHGRALFPQLKQFIATRSFALLWAGLMMSLPFAQLVGNGGFLRHAMGAGYIDGYKRVVEECAELAGYFIIFVGSMETIIQLRRLCRSFNKLLDN